MQRSAATAATGGAGHGGRPRAVRAASEPPAPTGPRGGTTTVTRSGQVKKNLWISREHAEALREKAFRERRSEAEIIREGLALVLEEGREA